MNFLNQISSGIGNIFNGASDMVGGAFQVITSPFALLGDIGNMFGGNKTQQWMNSPNGACNCGYGGYDPNGRFGHEMTQNARLANLERRLSFDEALADYRLSRGGL